MSFWKSKRIKATRKPHRCEYCSRIIPVGSSCQNEVGTYEGNFNHYYLCDRCAYYLDLFVDIQDEVCLGDLVGDLLETDLLNCPKCSGFSHRTHNISDDKQEIKLECDHCDHKWAVDLSLEALKRITKSA